MAGGFCDDYTLTAKALLLPRPMCAAVTDYEAFLFVWHILYQKPAQSQWFSGYFASRSSILSWRGVFAG
jgi:hypothetical protein